MPRLSRNALGFGVLSLGGLAWAGAATYYGQGREAIACSAIFLGFLLAATAASPVSRRRLGAGLAVASLGLIAPVLLYPGVWSASNLAPGLQALGTFAAAAAVTLRTQGEPSSSRRTTLLVQAFMGIVALGALLWVYDDWTGRLSWWAPGNALVLLGALWLVVRFEMRTTATSALSAAATGR